MNITRPASLCISCLILFSCGDSGDSTNTPYEGNWYDASSDSYLEITSDGTVFTRKCTINDGYSATESHKITDNDTLFFNSYSYELSRTGDKLTLSGEIAGNNHIIELVLKSSIPSACINDTIEITSVSPASVVEGISTEFTVSFDYRLTSKDAGIVYLGFNTSDPDGFILTDNTFEITQAELGSGSLTATEIPVFYDSPDSFKAYINLSENPHPTSWTPLQSVFASITVTKSTNSNSMTEPASQADDTVRCRNNFFVMCAQERKTDRVQ